MQQQTFQYQLDDVQFKGYIAYDDQNQQPRPTVLVVHDWTGCNDFAKDKANRLAKLGYVGIAVDMYGGGTLGGSKEEKAALIEPLKANRQLIVDRIQAAIDARPKNVANDDIAVIGYCFGGLCALDVARSAANIKGAVSLHGLLVPPADQQQQTISSKVLVLHGYDDPMVPPSQVEEFANEMTKRQADWQIHMYGHTMHAFANTEANDASFGTVYNAIADKRSWHALENFLQEIL